MESKINVNIENIEESFDNMTYSIANNTIKIEAIFELVNYKITSQSDDNNFEGNVEYILDTEFGGGPVNVTLPFIVHQGELEIDFDSLDYLNLLDWKEIDSEANLSFDYENDDDYDEDLDDSDEDYHMFENDFDD